MFTFLKLAFRNIFRFKRRTFITFCTISVGLALLVVSISLMNGTDKQSISNIIDCQTSHIKILKKGYFDKKDELPMNLTIKDAAGVHMLLKDIQGIRATESRVLFGAGLIKGMDELPCMGVGVNPELDPGLFNVKQSLTEGEWLEPGEHKMLVGKNLAEDIGLAVGDSVTVRMITSSEADDFSWNAVDLEVKGIFETGNPSVDGGRILMPLGPALEGLSLDGAVTEIVVRLHADDDKNVTAAQRKIEAVLKDHTESDLEVYTWKDLAGVFLAISAMKTQRTAMIVMIMMVIASMGIINTMLMAVMERTREIGMMAALGMKRREIMQLFIFEGGFIGIGGSLLGCLLGGLGGWYLEVYGWSLRSVGEAYAEMASAIYPVKDVIYADLTVGLLVVTFLLGTAISTLAAMYPAAKAARMKPIDALRHI